MRKLILAILGASFLVSACASLACAQNQVPLQKKLQTKLGKYATVAEPYEMWRKNPDTVKILDCRTAEEYVFVGHPPMADNIPFQLWSGKWDGTKKAYILEDNPDFMAKIREKFKPEDTILVLCSSGGRSAKAVDKLAEAGFKNVYNLINSCNGESGSGSKNGDNSWEIMKNCWKDSGAPWSYELDQKRVYIPQ